MSNNQNPRQSSPPPRAPLFRFLLWSRFFPQREEIGQYNFSLGEVLMVLSLMILSWFLFLPVYRHLEASLSPAVLLFLVYILVSLFVSDLCRCESKIACNFLFLSLQNCMVPVIVESVDSCCRLGIALKAPCMFWCACLSWITLCYIKGEGGIWKLYQMQSCCGDFRLIALERVEK